MADITIVFMGFINQLITGGHHPVQFHGFSDQNIDGIPPFAMKAIIIPLKGTSIKPVETTGKCPKTNPITQPLDFYHVQEIPEKVMFKIPKTGHLPTCVSILN